MITPGFGVGELLVGFIEVAFSLAFPVALLFILYRIYIKLRNIEEYLKKN